MQHLHHPAPAACRVVGQGAGGGVALRGPAAGPTTGSTAGPRTEPTADSEPEPEPPAPQNTALYWTFPGSALDVSLSRRWLAAAVEQAWGAGDDADRVVLAYSEVATNAVVHGAGPVTVTARIRAGTVTCEVTDCSARTPRLRHTTGEDVCGRGLDLVEMTVDRFRVAVSETGKTVSFEVGRHTGGPAGSGRSPLSWSGPSPVWTGREPEHRPGPRPEHEPEGESEHEPVNEPEPGLRSGFGPGSEARAGAEKSSVGGSAVGSADGRQESG